MQPQAAQKGPYSFEETGKSAVLTVISAGRSIAFVPYALKHDFIAVSGKVAGAGFVALNISAYRAAPLLSLGSIKLAALPGKVADGPYTAYNIDQCGSIELYAGRETPWIGRWADEIQGNFR